MWLLEQSALQRIESLEQGLTVDAESAFNLDSAKAKTTSSAGVSTIEVKGVLTETPDIWAQIFGSGNTSYRDFRKQLAKADADEKIKSIDLLVDSPGGNVAGLFETVAALQSVKKPIRAIVSGQAASAAYAIVAQAGEVVALSNATSVGSIGIVASMRVNDEVVTITSTNAPRKRPDVTTDEGKAMVREELDALHELFVDSIAEGRSTTSSKVNKNFGQGGVFLAKEALNRGMIDRVGLESKLSIVKPSAKQPENNPESKMDLETLKAQHRSVYDACVEMGVTAERERVSAHLEAADLSGDMKMASEAIKDGSDLTLSMQMKHLKAAANKKDISARLEEDADSGAGDEATSLSLGEQVAAILEDQRGVEHDV